MIPEFVPFDAADPLLDWQDMAAAIEAGHFLPRAQIRDSFLYRRDDTLLSRAAWIDGLGIGVKLATIFPGNAAHALATVNGGVSLFSDADGVLEAILDFHLVTRWKTAADSLLAARHLARRDAKELLVVGAGTVAASMIEAFRAGFPGIGASVWSRNRDRAAALGERMGGVTVADSLPDAVAKADIIVTATMARSPIVRGEWLSPGSHLNLVGAFRPDMREADDEALRRGRLFVDSRETTVEHIGELALPIASGVIRPEDVVADFYDIPTGLFTRRSPDEITVFKNGGGAHLDLMCSRRILDVWRSR
ncbi:MAG: ornithine cyclodeaminase [Alphaproteobacteria bacterium]|nr:MAG: ornithine cyclodeaminase [Alphaproteobacteria bacterium]